MEDVKKCLTVLNNVLLTKTFLVGERVSLADISVGCNLLMLYKQVCNNTDICFNPLSPNNHTQILQSDLHTFPLRISWENLTKDQGIVSLVIILLISHNHFSWQSMDILRRKLMLIAIEIWRVDPQHYQVIVCIDLYTFLKIAVEALLWTFFLNRHFFLILLPSTKEIFISCWISPCPTWTDKPVSQNSNFSTEMVGIPSYHGQLTWTWHYYIYIIISLHYHFLVNNPVLSEVFGVSEVNTSYTITVRDSTDNSSNNNSTKESVIR